MKEVRDLKDLTMHDAQPIRKVSPEKSAPGPSWGYFKSPFRAGLSTFGDNFPQKRASGSKNGAEIPE